MQCPVCNATCAENDNTCQRCHWEFEIFISDISEQTKNSNHQKRIIAQENWRKNNIEKDAPTEPEAQVTTNKLLYSEKTPVPELNRDPFEKFEEFAERINNYPPIPAGKMKLIKKDYSFYIGEFPVEIELTKNIRPSYHSRARYCPRYL